MKSAMKQIRSLNRKIPDVSVFRKLTSFLGKLGIDRCCSRNPAPPSPWTYTSNYREFNYGLSLRETIDLVQRIWSYELE